MPDERDADVLSRFVQGDQTAFEDLFRRFEGDVYRWIIRIVREPAAASDVLVESFWRAYRGRAQFDPTRSFGAWMRRIATNAALDELRSVHRRRWQPANDTLAAPSGSDRDLSEAIATAFRRLPPDLQAVAALALIEEQPYAEIADALRIPVGTVKSRVFRATRFLREELARLGVRPC
jgi:RNA polymerase sigma-70 factor (ECF subfamily)